jgi:hypothetical protein
VNQGGIALDPKVAPADGRLVFGDLLRVKNGGFGNFNVLAELVVKVEANVALFR